MVTTRNQYSMKHRYAPWVCVCTRFCRSSRLFWWLTTTSLAISFSNSSSSSLLPHISKIVSSSKTKTGRFPRFLEKFFLSEEAEWFKNRANAPLNAEHLRFQSERERSLFSPIFKRRHNRVM